MTGAGALQRLLPPYLVTFSHQAAQRRHKAHPGGDVIRGAIPAQGSWTQLRAHWLCCLWPGAWLRAPRDGRLGLGPGLNSTLWLRQKLRSGMPLVAASSAVGLPDSVRDILRRGAEARSPSAVVVVRLSASTVPPQEARGLSHRLCHPTGCKGGGLARSSAAGGPCGHREGLRLCPCACCACCITCWPGL